MGDVLAFIEQRDSKVRGVSREVLSAACAVAESLEGSAHALVLGGPGLAGSVGELASHGASRVKVAEHERLARYEPDAFAATVAAVARSGSYEAILFPATSEGRDLAPRVAALLDVPLATDVTGLAVEGGKIAVTRPVFSGKAIARLEIAARPVVVSVRPNAFPPVQRQAAGSVERVEPTVEGASPRTRVREFRAAEGGALDVSEAGIVVSGGRGLKGPENWHLLEDLRDAIGNGTALGASRAVVDAGWRPHGEQVGQTGKTVSPKLYFAIGVSGAIQHLAGMRTAQVIVAVNKDPDAPIFKVADYGIVGDAMEVVPRLAAEIRALKARG